MNEDAASQMALVLADALPATEMRVHRMYRNACKASQCVAVCCTVLKCVVVCRSTSALQCVAVCSSVLQ